MTLTVITDTIQVANMKIKPYETRGGPLILGTQCTRVCYGIKECGMYNYKRNCCGIQECFRP